jgi:hypothetical protein
MEPTRKSFKVGNLLNALLGASREDTIRANKCIPPPIGCGEPVTEFRDETSKREYSISGMCQKCQDATFGS